MGTNLPALDLAQINMNDSCEAFRVCNEYIDKCKFKGLLKNELNLDQTPIKFQLNS